ncbi:MAG: GGDEF domain-containing protein [Lachnospiraceae bacterium]|nr:GGDEF domain-containing protein [Lachnospiraceae bacterium]
MKRWRTAALHIILFILAVAGFLIVYVRAGLTREKSDKVELSKGWKIKVNYGASIHSSTFEDVNLDEFRFEGVERGDWFVLTSTLPDVLPENPTMMIRVPYSVTTVYVGGEEVFSYGREDYEKGLLVGAGVKFFPIPDDSAGKSVKMTLFATEEQAFSNINTPIIRDETHAVSEFLQELQLPCSVALSLITAGLAIALVTFCMYFRSFSIERLFCIGVFSLCIGSWSFCSYNLNILITDNLRLKSYLEFAGLYLSTIPLLLYFREDVEKRARKWETRTYFTVLLILIQMFIITMILNFTGTFHFPRFFTVYLFILLFVVLYTAVLIWRDFRGEHKHRLLVWGVVVLLAIGLRDIVGYALVWYTDIAGTQSSFHTYTAAGAFVFVVTLMADFIIEVRQKTYIEAENKLLMRIAYNDVLTGLSTRRRCEEVFKEIDAGNKEFAIVQFDLNNLKRVNDALGHEKGDEMITRFADALKIVFSQQEVIGRMGGDEFIVIVPDTKGYKLDLNITKLETAVNKDNSKHEDVQVSYSCGYCYSEEIDEPTTAKVYAEADRRMYEQKEKFYRERGYGRRKNDNA